MTDLAWTARSDLAMATHDPNNGDGNVIALFSDCL